MRNIIFILFYKIYWSFVNT